MLKRFSQHFILSTHHLAGNVRGKHGVCTSSCIVSCGTNCLLQDDSVFSTSTDKPKSKKMGEDIKRLDSQDGKPRKPSIPTATNLKPGEQNIVIALDGSEESTNAVNCKF